MSRLSRKFATAVTIAALGLSSVVSPASAGALRRGDERAGAAIALGIGALVVGSILAAKSRDTRHADFRREPAPPRYSHPAPHINRAPVRDRASRGR